MRKFPIDYPHRVAIFCADIPTAYSGSTPTIAAVSQVHGVLVSTTIIVGWLTTLDSYIGKGSLTPSQIEELSVIMLQSGYFVKLAELAVFFQMLKAGRFGQLYGSISPIWIMEQFQAFLSVRRQEIEKYEREQERIRKDREREEWKANKATPEQVADIRRQFDKGANELLDLITNTG